MIESALSARIESLERYGSVLVIDLRPADGATFPAFAAGSHIDITAGPELIRQYSLLNDPRETHRYVIAVALEANGRGGSQYVHEHFQAGDTVHISAPRCHFHLDESASHSVLIAGGIGITPIWCMAQRLMAIGASFELHYGARSRAEAVLIDEIETTLATYGARFEAVYAPLPLIEIFDNSPLNSHFYACGPAPMLDVYVEAGALESPDHVHLERFSSDIEAATAGGYTVELARSGFSIEIEAGQTILDAVKAKGISISYSCAEGICGACETTVLEGIPDHRDSVLTDTEKAANTSMMVCCSGSCSPKLVLDI
ncbi:MAG: PDR/VanB family oxidoreductase [Asticcacaulis sp.]